MPGSGGRESASSLRVEIAWRTLLLLALLFKEFALPGRAPTPALDESWQAVKGWELLNGIPLGTQSVFTYGPLGWFYAAPHIPELFNAKIWGFELVVKGLCALACVDLVATLRGRAARVLAALALLWIPAGLDAFGLIAIAAVGMLLIRQPQLPRARELLFLSAAVMIAEVKFSYLMLYAGMLLCVSLAHDRRRGVRIAVLGAGLFLGSWLLLGQSLANFPRYVQTSLWIAGGYNEAMSVEGPAPELKLALLAMLAVAILIVIGWRAQQHKRTVLMSTALTAGALYLAFKAGFTRHMGNSMIFFACAPVFGSWWLSTRNGLVAARLQPLCGVFLLVIGALGYTSSITMPGQMRHFFEQLTDTWSAKWDSLRALPGLRETRERGRQGIARFFDLPRIRSIVGNERVDVLHSAAAIALINDFQYAPRPVFQSYAAYTPELLELNRAYFAGPQAPRFVLLRHETIDDRLPPLDDAPALLEILQRYEARIGEKGYMLLEKKAGEPMPVERMPLDSRDVQLGEWIDATRWQGAALWMRVRWEPTLAGRARTLLLRGVPMRMEYELEDGRTIDQRLCRASAQAGFLLRPFVEDQDGWSRLLSGQPLPAIRRLRFHAPTGLEHCLASSLRFEVEELRGLLPPADEHKLALLAYTCFDPEPDGVSALGPLRQQEIEGRMALVFQAPGSVRFMLPPGDYRLRARYGLLQEAWVNNCSDGVAFQFALLAQDHPLKLLHMDPILSPDPGTREADLVFSTDAAGELVLRCTAGPAGATNCDWAYWQEVSIQRQ